MNNVEIRIRIGAIIREIGVRSRSVVICLMSRAMLNEFAIIVNPDDNVAVVKKAIPAGITLSIAGRPIRVLEEITSGNRFALRSIPAGEFVRQYGQPIGTSLG